MKLFLLGTITFLLFNLVLDNTLKTMTKSDCLQGIEKACEYVNSTQKLINDI